MSDIYIKLPQKKLYRVEELCTTGWCMVSDKLLRVEASELLQKMLDEGYAPDHIRAVPDED